MRMLPLGGSLPGGDANRFLAVVGVGGGRASRCFQVGFDTREFGENGCLNCGKQGRPTRMVL